MESVNLIPFIKKHWYSVIGILVAELALALFLATFTNLLGIPLLYAISLIFFCLVLLIIFWIKSKKPPKTPRNKIGFLVSIYCSDESDRLKIKEDLLVPLRSYIKTGKAGELFHFMELQQHNAEICLDYEQAQRIRIQSGAHYMLFGRVRKRPLDDGKIHYIFELEGAVSHAEIPEQHKKNLSKEFSELLPRRVQILAEQDILSFQFTSDWAGLVAKYIIGIATACSGDIAYAEKLYDDVIEGLNSQDTSFPIFAKLKERLPVRKAELYEAMATAQHREWVESRDNKLIEQMHEWLQKIDKSQQNRPGVLYLSAICAFVKDLDADSAIEFVNKINQNNDPTWHLNLAFLYGYKGNLQKSIRHYRSAAQLNIQIDTINQVESFINWVIDNFPEKVQLHYILGFFNWQIREDGALARQNFEFFLKYCGANDFIKEQKLTRDWLEKI